MRNQSKTNPIIADISIPMFKTAARFAAHHKETERAYLQGVRIQRHPKRGVVLIATDGRHLLALHDERGVCKKSMTLNARIGTRVAAVRGFNNRWQIRAGQDRRKDHRVPLIDLPYPEWERVVKASTAKKTSGVLAVNPLYLSDFCRASVELQDVDSPYMRIVAGETGSDPIWVLFPNAPHALGILMPVVDAGDRGLPAWLACVVREEAEAFTEKAKPEETLTP